MFTTIKKRDGRDVAFDETKITEAIFKAAKSVGGADKQLAMELTLDVLRFLKQTYLEEAVGVEEVQDAVEKILIEKGHAKTAKAYILYRAKRTRMRADRSELMEAVAEILSETPAEALQGVGSVTTKMLQIAAAASKAYYLNRLLPEEYANAHLRADFHIHDLEYYGQTVASVQLPLQHVLQQGFYTGQGYVKPPQQVQAIAAFAALLLQNAAQDMRGSQGYAFFERDMAVALAKASEPEVEEAMEFFLYQLNALRQVDACQTTFTLNIGTDTTAAGRRISKALLLAYEKGMGHGEMPLSPQIVFRLQEGVNLRAGEPNYDLFRLAIRVAAQRRNPTFSFMDASFNKLFNGNVAYLAETARGQGSVGTVSTPENSILLSITTLNLPRLALQAKRNVMDFYQSLSDLIDVACAQLYHRYQLQAGLTVKELPFLMGQVLGGELAELAGDAAVAPVMRQGMLALGFIGLAETLVVLTGAHHAANEEARALGEEIVAFMRNKVDKAAERYQVRYGLLATPNTAVLQRFSQMDLREFGLVPGVTDQPVYTHSFHIPPEATVNVYRKLEIEGVYHKYTNAGHISYMPFDAPPANHLDAVEDVLCYMRQCDIGYAALQTPLSTCESCGYSGLLEPSCPVCAAR